MIEILRWLAEAEVADGPFAAPGYLALLGIVPVLVAVMVWLGRRHRVRLERAFGAQLAEQVRPPAVRRRRLVRDVLLVVALTAGIVALAGPRFDKRVQLVEARGVDLVLVVDLSRSMDAEDVEPSRLERTRREIYDLLEVLEGDRVGLVVFAGGAYPRVPLTEDQEVIRMIASEMSSSDFQSQGSALDEAIREAAELLTRDEASQAGRAMIVFSDGEIHDPAAAIEAAQAARDQEVRVFSMRVGDAPAPIPLGNGGWQQDRQGRRVVSTPSDDTLRDIAQAGGGVFTTSSPAADDVRALYRSGVRRLLDAGVRGVKPKIRWRSAWVWPLGLAVVCGLLGAWLGEGRRRWGLAAAAVLAVALAVPSIAHAATLADADRAYREGRYEEASRILTELSYDQPGDRDLQERLGAARYRAGDMEGAVRAWERQAEAEGRSRQETLFNLGNAHARSGRYQTALDHYDEVLALGPHPRSEQNRSLVQAEMERRMAEQPPPESNEESEESEQESESDEGGESGEGTDSSNGSEEPSGDEGEEGEEGDEAEEGEEGEADSTEESAGGAEGDQTKSDREQSGDQPTGEDGGKKQAGDDQERKEDSESDSVRPDDLDVDPSEEGGEGQAGGEGEDEPADEPAMTQAERLLEGVEEGRPRITIPGGAQEKPW